MLENPVAYVVNPGRPKTMKKRRTRKHARRTRRRNAIVYANRARRRHRRHNAFVYANRGHGRRRRRNPGGAAGIMGKVRNVLAMSLPAVAGGFVAGFVDSKFLAGKNAVIRYGAKVGLAVVAGIALSKRPAAAAAAMGGIIGTIGSDLGVKMGGGVVASSKAAGMKELAAMAADDGDLALLMREELSGYGLGLIVQDQPGRGDGLGESDSEGMGDEGGTPEAHIDGDNYDAA
jgi:hypothetical protein